MHTTQKGTATSQASLNELAKLRVELASDLEIEAKTRDLAVKGALSKIRGVHHEVQSVFKESDNMSTFDPSGYCHTQTPTYNRHTHR